jgi:methylated-DNA-[protein]-cysteine S-methyltransferase
VLGTAPRYVLFETALGTCAVAFGGRGVIAVGLPEANLDAMIARFDRYGVRGGRPVPSEIDDAIAAITAHLRGEIQDLAEIRTDLERISEFDRRVYQLTRRISPGSTRTYGDLASDLGDPELSRAVGQALGRNPVPLIIPCHRVVRAGGRLGGFSAIGGIALKRRLLSIERACGPQLDLLD